MTLLSKIRTGAEAHKPRGIIYGAPGVGKTTLLAQPGHIIIDMEGGADLADGDRTPPVATWQEAMAWLDELRASQYRVVVIDTYDLLVRCLIEAVVVQTGKRGLMETLNAANGGYGAGKQAAENHIHGQLLPRLSALGAAGKAVILLAHSRRDDLTDDAGVTRERTTLDAPEWARNPVVRWADFVILARKSAAGARELVTEETLNLVAKNRYGLPPVLPMDWQALRGAIGEAIRARVPARPQEPDAIPHLDPEPEPTTYPTNEEN